MASSKEELLERSLVQARYTEKLINRDPRMRKQYENTPNLNKIWQEQQILLAESRGLTPPLFASDNVAVAPQPAPRQLTGFTAPPMKHRSTRAHTPPLPAPVRISNSFQALSDDEVDAPATEVAAVADQPTEMNQGKQRKKRRKQRVQSNTQKLAVPIVLPTRPRTPEQTTARLLPKPAQPATRPQYERVVQCYRCQGFGHYAVTCPNSSRCVKCADEHDAPSCPRPREQLATCANCSGPHPASYRGCPSWRFAIKSDRSRRPRARPPPSKPVDEEDPPTMEGLCRQLASLATSPVMVQIAKLLSLLAAADPAQHAALLLAAVTATL